MEKDLLTLTYQTGMTPTINKPTRNTRKAARAINLILNNTFPK